MPTPQELEKTFWKTLKADMTVMLGLDGVAEGHSRPMTTQFDGEAERGPVWFFTAKNTELVNAMGTQHRAIAHFASKDHELFASLHGELCLDNDRQRVDRLWNPFVAAWYPGGKNDPQLQLLRFEPTHAQIWLNETSLLAGIKILLGRDPKKDFQDKVAEVSMSGRP